MRYFITGHFWIFVAGLLFLGQEPTNWEGHSRFFGVGRQFNDLVYFAGVLVIAAFGVLHLFRAWKADGSMELVMPGANHEQRPTPHATSHAQQPG